MTGKSDLSTGCLEYYKKLGGAAMIVVGAFLLLEHLYQFGGFDLEVLGHEWYGFALIAAAILLNMKWKQLPGVIAAFKDRNLHKLLDEGER